MSRKVLLCDDEVHILRAAEFKLQRGGFDVRCAGDGQEAWELISQDCPDLLVTDCQMPRMNGLELAQRVRSHPATRHLPVIMLTAKGFELSHRELQETYGIVAVMPKPFSPRLLLEQIQRLLSAPSPGSGPTPALNLPRMSESVPC
jgi:CheY-like chemotaxis protein